MGEAATGGGARGGGFLVHSERSISSMVGYLTTRTRCITSTLAARHAEGVTPGPGSHSEERLVWISESEITQAGKRTTGRKDVNKLLQILGGTEVCYNTPTLLSMIDSGRRTRFALPRAPALIHLLVRPLGPLGRQSKTLGTLTLLRP